MMIHKKSPQTRGLIGEECTIFEILQSAFIEQRIATDKAILEQADDIVAILAH